LTNDDEPLDAQVLEDRIKLGPDGINGGSPSCINGGGPMRNFGVKGVAHGQELADDGSFGVAERIGFFGFGAAFVVDEFGLEALEPEAYTHEATLALARLVSCEADPDADFPRHYSGEVIVELQDGRVLRHREAVNRGGEGRPVTQAEIEAKFFDNATRAVPRAHAQRIRDAVLDMETLASARTLASLLGEHFPGHAA
jgi:hypothetical protein